MKKLLLITAGTLLAASTAFAQETAPEFYLIGQSVDNISWKEGSNKMTYNASTGLYEWTGNFLGTSFKINNGSWGNPDFNIGVENPDSQLTLGTPLKVVTESELSEGAPGDIYFNGYSCVYNPKVTFDYTKMEVTITGDGANPLFVIGNNANFVGWDLLNSQNAMTYNSTDNTYTWEGTILKSGFKINNGSWNKEYGGVKQGDDAPQISLGTAYTVTDSNAGDIFFDNFTFIFNPKIVLNLNNNTLVLTGTKFTNDNLWGLVGSFGDWTFLDAAFFTGEDNELSVTVPYLTTGFKVVNLTDNNWDTQYGYSESILPNEEYILEGKNEDSDSDPSNIEFGKNAQGKEILAITNAIVTWNPSTAAFQIKAADSDIEAGYPKLYISGSFNNWPSPQESSYVGVLDESNGTYTFKVNLGETGEASFKIATYKWGIAYGTEDENADVAYEPVNVVSGGNNITTSLKGEQTLVFEYDNENPFIYFVELPDDEDDEEEDQGPTGAVNSIENSNEPVEYYNLQGVKVTNPDKGIYIIRQGNKTQKTVIR